MSSGADADSHGERIGLWIYIQVFLPGSATVRLRHSHHCSAHGRAINLNANAVTKEGLQQVAAKTLDRAVKYVGGLPLHEMAGILDQEWSDGPPTG